MIVEGHASLILSSTVHTVSHITCLLGIEPTAVWENGDLTGGTGPDENGNQVPWHRTASMWGIDIHDEDFDTMGDQTGTASLRRLAEVMTGKGPTLDTLREHFHPTILWSGESDSHQGGFVMEADLLLSLAALGCDLMGTVYVQSKKKRKKNSRKRKQ